MKDARAQIVVIDDHRVVGFITIISGPQLIPPWDSPFGMAQWPDRKPPKRVGWGSATVVGLSNLLVLT